MQPIYRPTEVDRHSYRLQPLEPARRSKPWVVPVALAFLIVLLLIVLISLAQQAPTSPDPVVNTILDTTP